MSGAGGGLRHSVALLAAFLLLLAGLGTGAAAAESIVRIYRVDGATLGETIGTLHLSDGKGGVLFAARLRNLAAGPHGLHFKASGACGTLAASGPAPRASYRAQAAPPPPQAPAHDRDLPPLLVGKDGVARATVTEKGLKLAEVEGGLLVIDRVDGASGIAACGLVPQ
jgi:Cu/Zn superoxide dismutase